MWNSESERHRRHRHRGQPLSSARAVGDAPAISSIENNIFSRQIIWYSLIYVFLTYLRPSNVECNEFGMLSRAITACYALIGDGNTMFRLGNRYAG